MKLKHFFTTILLVLIGVSGTLAQPNFDFGKKQAEIWKLAKRRTVAVANAMPALKYSYKPTPEVKSFGQQMAHISNSMLSMDARFIKKTSYRGREKDASTMTKEQIIADLESAFDQVIDGLSKISDSDLMAQGKPHGAFPLTKWESYLFMYDHITNHRAKTVLYLRSNGITPPNYGYN